MELRMKRYYSRKYKGGGTLVCSKCGDGKQIALFEGDVCRDCWEGYDIEAGNLLYCEQIRVQVGARIAGGLLKKEIAADIGWSGARVGQFLNGHCDSLEIAEALDQWLKGNIPERRFTKATEADKGRVNHIRNQARLEMERQGLSQRELARRLGINAKSFTGYLCEFTHSLRITERLEEWLKHPAAA